MIRLIIPTLRVSDVSHAQKLFEVLNFQEVWSHREGDGPLFMEMANEHCAVFLSEHEGDGPLATQLYCLVEDAVAVHKKLLDAGVQPASQPAVSDWGHLSFEVQDDDGNVLRIGSPIEE